MPVQAKHAGPIEARMGAVAFTSDSETPPDWIMWMPGGIHTITATQGGQPATIRLKVDRRAAALVQQQFSEMAAARPAPYFDFDHDNKAASGFPKEFRWQDTPEPGIYARVDWSRAGADAVSGRAYRAFSPRFFADQSKSPAVLAGVPTNMGGLVNDPAFRTIKPHTAKHAEMNKSEQIVSLLAAINGLYKERTALAAKGAEANATLISAKDAEIAAKEGELSALRAEDAANGDDVTLKVMDAKGALEAKDQQIQQLQQRLNQSDTALAERRRADAISAVQGAVARGVIPAQDKARQDAWQARIEKDPSLAEELGRMGGEPITAGRLIQDGRVTIVSEDTRRIVQAYHAAISAKDRGVIYVKDLRDRMKAGDDLVIQAANTLGGVTGNLIAQRSLDLLKTEFPMLDRISANFSEANADYGQTVKTRLLAPPAVTDYNTSTGYATSGVTTTDVDVVINAHKAVQIEFNVNEMASTRRLLFEEQREGVHFSLGEALVSALYALITAANFNESGGTTTKALNSFARTTVTNMAKTLNTRKVPKAGRTLLLNGDYFESLVNDSPIVSLGTQQRADLIEKYTLPPIAGFQPFEAVDLPTTGNLVGFGLAPSALAMATRVPNDYTTAFPGLPSTGVTSVVTNPDTGVSVMLVQFVDHKLGTATMRMALMFGVAVGNKKCGQLLISS